MKLIVGLGNPGPEYQVTRHNAGFMALDLIREYLTFSKFKTEEHFKAEISAGNVENQKIILAKPKTFMNLSGRAVQTIMHFYKIPPQDAIIIYDDIDLPFGNVRLRKSGGPGTHNGMKSITASIGEDFPRIRIGINNDMVKRDLAGFVLSRFTKDEETLLPSVLEKVAKATFKTVYYDIDKAMTEVNNPQAI